MERKLATTTLPAIKLNSNSKTVVHIGWIKDNHYEDGYCLCGQNEAMNHKSDGLMEEVIQMFTGSSNWIDCSVELFPKITCKKCIQAWEANHTRPGDKLSAREYIYNKIEREHRQNTTRTGISYKSEPNPDATKEEKIEVNEEQTPISNNRLPIPGDNLFITIRVNELSHVPLGQNVKTYKCGFCCYNGYRPCPQSNINNRTNSLLCEAIGPLAYFVEVLTLQ